MKVLKGFLLGFVAILLLFWGIGYLLPKRYAAEKVALIAAPIEVVFGAVTDLTVWTEWEPWGIADESMEISFGEITQGPGASYNWSGKKTGEGTLTILSTEPPTEARYRFVFNGQTETPAEAVMALEALDASTTRVTWTIEGELGSSGAVARYLGLLVGPMIEESFKVGLERLKALCEGAVEPGVVAETP